MLVGKDKAAQVHPRLLAWADWCAQRLPERNGKRPDLLITEGIRSNERQDRLFAQGRNSAGVIIDLASVVTYAQGGESPHNPGPEGDAYALDVVPMVSGKAEWNDTALWDFIGVSVRRFNLEVPGESLRWGGEFTNLVDRPHVEVTAWRSLKWPQVVKADYVAPKASGFVGIAMTVVGTLALVGAALFFL